MTDATKISLDAAQVSLVVRGLMHQGNGGFHAIEGLIRAGYVPATIDLELAGQHYKAACVDVLKAHQGVSCFSNPAWLDTYGMYSAIAHAIVATDEGRAAIRGQIAWLETPRSDTPHLKIDPLGHGVQLLKGLLGEGPDAAVRGVEGLPGGKAVPGAGAARLVK